MNFSVHLDGYGLPKVPDTARVEPSRLSAVYHPDRGEVAFWVSTEDGHSVAYLEPSEVDRLYNWLVEYRKGRL